MKMKNINILVRESINLLLIFLAFLLFSSSCTSKWPQFRGPESNQLTDEKNLPLEWGNDKNIEWKTAVEGRGWSCPVIWGDKLFFTSAVLVDSTQERIRREGGDVKKINPADAYYSWEVYCLDVNSGEELWKQTAYEGIPKIPTHRDNTYASETTVTDGKRLYVYFGMIGLYCYDMDGNLIWEKDLGSYSTGGDWGTSTSPVLHDNILYLQFDNEEKSFLVAFESGSGQEKWRVSRDEKTNYSTPLIWKNKVRTELVTTGKIARSYDPLTGKLLWELNLKGGRSIVSPVGDKEMIYLGNEKRQDGGGFLFGVKAGVDGNITPEEGDSTSLGVVWSLPESGLAMASPLLYEGLIYVVERRRGMIFCYEAATGRPVYQNIKVPDAGAFWASPWAVDGRIFCLDEKGTTHVIKAGEQFEVIGQHKLDDKFWASLAIANNAYYFRGVDNIYCIKK